MSHEPEDIWNATEAAEIAILATHPTWGSKILVMGLDGRVALDLNRGLALALGTRLIELAQQVEEQRIVRRPADVDDHLRQLDD